MCPDIIFQILLPRSRPYDITSCDTSCDCDVTCLFIVQKEKKRKRKQNPYKVRKENKNCSCPKRPITDGSLRLVQDYWKSNQITIKDKTPLPLIGEVIDKLKEAKYFNKLDLIGDITTYESKKAMNGKQLSSQTKDCLSPK